MIIEITTGISIALNKMEELPFAEIREIMFASDFEVIEKLCIVDRELKETFYDNEQFWEKKFKRDLGEEIQKQNLEIEDIEYVLKDILSKRQEVKKEKTFCGWRLMYAFWKFVCHGRSIHDRHIQIIANNILEHRPTKSWRIFGGREIKYQQYVLLKLLSMSLHNAYVPNFNDIAVKDFLTANALRKKGGENAWNTFCVQGYYTCAIRHFKENTISQKELVQGFIQASYNGFYGIAHFICQQSTFAIQSSEIKLLEICEHNIQNFIDIVSTENDPCHFPFKPILERTKTDPFITILEVKRMYRKHILPLVQSQHQRFFPKPYRSSKAIDIKPNHPLRSRTK